MTAPRTWRARRGADVPTKLTNGFHLIVDALRVNGVTTIYGVVGIPITDLARLAQARGSGTSGSAMRPAPGTPRPRRAT